MSQLAHCQQENVTISALFNKKTSQLVHCSTRGTRNQHLAFHIINDKKSFIFRTVHILNCFPLKYIDKYKREDKYKKKKFREGEIFHPIFKRVDAAVTSSIDWVTEI